MKSVSPILSGASSASRTCEESPRVSVPHRVSVLHRVSALHRVSVLHGVSVPHRVSVLQRTSASRKDLNVPSRLNPGIHSLRSGIQEKDGLPLF